MRIWLSTKALDPLNITNVHSFPLWNRMLHPSTRRIVVDKSDLLYYGTELPDRQVAHSEGTSIASVKIFAFLWVVLHYRCPLIPSGGGRHSGQKWSVYLCHKTLEMSTILNYRRETTILWRSLSTSPFQTMVTMDIYNAYLAPNQSSRPFEHYKCPLFIYGTGCSILRQSDRSGQKWSVVLWNRTAGSSSRPFQGHFDSIGKDIGPYCSLLR
jgi:hypothetical protein